MTEVPAGRPDYDQYQHPSAALPDPQSNRSAETCKSV